MRPASPGLTVLPPSASRSTTPGDPRPSSGSRDRLARHPPRSTLPDGVEQTRRAGRRSCAGQIGNHTARHPAARTRGAGTTPSRTSPRWLAGEIADANARIADASGPARTFAYPAATFVGRGVQTQSYVLLVAERFVAGRTSTTSPSTRLCTATCPGDAKNSDGPPSTSCASHSRPRSPTGPIGAGGHDRASRQRGDHAGHLAVVEWCRSHDVWID